MLRILILTILLAFVNSVEVQEKQTIDNEVFDMENHDLSKKIFVRKFG